MPIYPDKKDGKLTGRYRVEVQLEGRRLRSRVDGFKDAQDKEREFKKLIVSGEAPEAKKRIDGLAGRPQTFVEALKKSEGRLWRGMTGEVNNFVQLRNILATIGDLKLDAIGTSEVDDVIESLRGRGLKEATINRYLSSFRTFLGWCLEREYRTKPLPDFEWGKETNRIRWITFDEEALLMDLLPEKYALLVKVAITTGMRRGELLTLTREQVDPEWVRLWNTKNDEPRSVPIDQETYEDLMTLIEDGMPSQVQLRHQWGRARKLMGLESDPWFVFHACRHTCATRLVDADVNLAVVKEFMGHRTIETTLKYAHVNSMTLRDALRKASNHKDRLTHTPTRGVVRSAVKVRVEKVGDIAPFSTETNVRQAA